ncbi:MAG: 2TM domain-containing protein [Candidatus Nanopelagicales bacterium]
MSNDDQLRAAAVKRIKDKRNAISTVGIFVIVSILLTAIWALSGGGYFWPAWAMFGMGIAALFILWGTFGPQSRQPSEQEISDEMRRMRGQ